MMLATMVIGLALGTDPSREPPPIPIGYDAFTEWHRWPYLRVGVRAFMRSTFDRTGGNHYADASHYLRQTDAGWNVALDEVGPGILWFVRHNHWHGSPWHYFVDGRETVVSESSTADPLHPIAGSVFLPEASFPPGLTWTWSTTHGADLSWVPMPFEHTLELDYERACYGTGYFILWKLMPGIALSRPLASWTPEQRAPRAVLDLLAHAGEDIAPTGEPTTTLAETFELAPFASKSVCLGRGPSMIRQLRVRVPRTGATALAAARLRVFFDDRTHASVDAPLGLFFGTGSLSQPEGDDVLVKSLPMSVRFVGEACEFACYLPMPCVSGARVEISETRGVRIDGIELSLRTVAYQDPPNWVAPLHATYRDFARPEPGRDLVLLDTREVEGGGDWCGHLVGTTYLFTRRGELSTLEGDPRFYFDDSLTPQCQGTGSEEWGGGGDYWGGRAMSLPFAGHPVGKPPGEAKQDADRIHSAYRFLLSDLMPFGRNARVTLEHGAGSLSTEHYETVTYWYGRDEPMLIATDELDVGDLDDERRHDYRSPDAALPQTLVSRFELGEDHRPLGSGRAELLAPLADDGRVTTTASEFTIQLTPRNLGVLLRRRLDLALPDQRARVLVADVGDGETWHEAGVWYTAGSNTVVFADPRAVPKEQRTVPAEIAPSAQFIETSNRRFREDEFLLPRALTEGRDQVRVRCEYVAQVSPLLPGRTPAKGGWSEYRYAVSCFVMPGLDGNAGR